MGKPACKPQFTESDYNFIFPGEPVCRPEFVEGDAAWVEFKDLRHPALCVRSGLKDFIPNNVKLGRDVGRIALLTGEFCYIKWSGFIADDQSLGPNMGYVPSQNVDFLVVRIHNTCHIKGASPR